MKVLTANFVTCAVKSCKSSAASFPLHFRDAELEQQELEFQPTFIRNVLPRVDWDALRTTATEVSSALPRRGGDALSIDMTYNVNESCAQVAKVIQIWKTDNHYYS